MNSAQAAVYDLLRPMSRQKHRLALSLGLLAFAFSALYAGALRAHGGVFLDEDQCVIQIGFFRGHFTIFQPRTRQHIEYCEDLPEATETVFVLEYLHDGLEQMPIDFRIIRDITGLGRFVKLDDIQAIEHLDAATVFYKAALIEPDVYSVVHTFDSPGDYIGVVVAQSADTGTPYTAVFPFAVGKRFDTTWIPGGLAVLMLALAVGYVVARRIRHTRNTVLQQSGIVLVTLLAVANAEAADITHQYPAISTAHFQIQARPHLWPIRINAIHAWEIWLTSLDGTPIEQAQISLSGGMPEHDHGLPTSPQMTQHLGGGRYLVEGVKFHMNGHWEVMVAIRTDSVQEAVTFKFAL